MSIQKLVYAEPGEFTPPLGVNYNDHFNDLPTPYWEVDINEYLHYSGIWSYKFREFRQARLPEYFPADPRVKEPKKWHVPLKSLHIEWYADRGYAIVQPSAWGLYNSVKADQVAVHSGLLKPNDIFYKEPTRYFRIGCTHENMTSSWPRMHDRHDNCPDCGYHAVYDTSG